MATSAKMNPKETPEKSSHACLCCRNTVFNYCRISWHQDHAMLVERSHFFVYAKNPSFFVAFVLFLVQAVKSFEAKWFATRPLMPRMDIDMHESGTKT